MSDIDSQTNPQKESPKLSREKLQKALEIFVFIKPYSWSLFMGLLLLFLSSMVFMVFPFLSGELINIAQGISKYPYSLEQVGVFLILVLILQGLVSYYRVKLFATVSEKGIAAVRTALYQKLISMPIVFFENTRTGELVSRLTADVEKLYNAFSITLAEFLRQVILLISGLIILAVLTPHLSLIMLATFPVIVVGALFFGRYVRRLSKERQAELADTNIILSETMQTIQVVKAFSNEFFELSRYRKSVKKTVDVSLKYASVRSVFSVFIITILFGSIFFIIWAGAVLLRSGEIDAGKLVSFVVYTAVLGGAIAGLGNFYTEIVGAIGATERIRDILNQESEIDSSKPAAETKVERLSGELEFKGVQFHYPTRPDIEVLKSVSFHIPAGHKVALVGPSGAGKSTIIQLLLKFYEIQSGEILADGRSIFDLSTTAYRQNVALVPQEVLLFGGSIRENLLYGKPDATDAELMEAARQANAWEFIQSFPERLETVVGERGVKLSGGQRQRIAIARAILRNPAILLLDEATSSLDAESEKVVQEALDKLMEGRTSIIVAHRLSTIRQADCIYVLNHGEIVEMGTHEELIQSANGLYQSLARMQFEYS
jgi:ABC-type multidrug transport system fused ATPase/permease subunit